MNTPQGYVLQNQISHFRHLPADSTHSFAYHSFNSRRIFGYGGKGRLVGIRPEHYLTNSSCTIRFKLEAILKDRNYSNLDEYIHDAWIMTMPSFLGFEGMNPLTVYFCYGSDKSLRLVILEVDDALGGRHVDVLEVNQKDIPSRGYDHQWTFPREFQVSPFNDRSGFYTVSIKNPSHPPTPNKIDFQTKFEHPRPSVRVHMFLASEEDPSIKGALKMRALLRPTTATPLTSISLLYAISQAPFDLLLTYLRILFNAWKLHYRKRLDVFPRPEPLVVVKDSCPIPALGGCVRWQDERVFERFCRDRISKFLKKRAEELGVEIILIATDPSVPRLSYSSSNPAHATLKISYKSSRMFTILFMTPSAQHALLFGCDAEEIFQPSSRDLFKRVFSSNIQPMNRTWAQHLRIQPLPQSLSLSIPNSHFIDVDSFVISVFLIISLRFLEWLDLTLYQLARVRFVKGQEPRHQWDRAAKLHIKANPMLSCPMRSAE